VSVFPFGFSPARRAAEKNDAGPRTGPASIHHHSTFASRETDVIPRRQFANSEGVLGPLALLSQDAEQAAHERSLPDEKQAAPGVQLQCVVQSVDEERAAHEL